MTSLLVEKQYLLEDKYQSVMFQITIYCFANNLYLSKGEIKALSYFYLDGVLESTENIILEKGIFSNPQSLKNLKTKLVGLNIIKKIDKVYTINNFMGIGTADRLAISIKAGNK